MLVESFCNNAIENVMSSLEEFQGKPQNSKGEFRQHDFHCFPIYLVLWSLSVVAFLTKAEKNKKKMGSPSRKTSSQGCPSSPHCRGLALAQRLTPFSALVALYLLGLPLSRAPSGLSFFPLSKDPKGVPGPSGWAPRLPHRGYVVQQKGMWSPRVRERRTLSITSCEKPGGRGRASQSRED